MRTKWELRAEGESSDKINSIWGVLSATENQGCLNPLNSRKEKCGKNKKRLERTAVMCSSQHQSLRQGVRDLPSQTPLRALKYHLELPRMV